VTLDVARHRKPMVGVYKAGLITWLGAKAVMRARYFLLPNLIAEREIVPEFVPYLGGSTPIVNAANKYLIDSKNAANLSEELNRVCLRYSNKKPAEEAARWIIKIIRDGTPDEVPGKSTPTPKPVKTA
jgi:lipid-A-disaccharide synthase